MAYRYFWYELLGGGWYLILYVDDYSGLMRCVLPVTQVWKPKFADWVCKSLEKQFNIRLNSIRCDDAKEFATKEIKAFCRENGISRQVTVPYAHQTKGTAERYIRTVVTMVRAMLHHACLPKEFWVEFAQTAVYIKNRLSNPKHKEATPYEILYKYKPSMKHLRFLLHRVCANTLWAS